MSSGIEARRAQDQELVGVLLHSLSQPLTTLCCSLELSMEKTAGQQQEAVAAALEQAERVIGLVRLLREYLDAELTQPFAKPANLVPILRDVVEEISSVAAVRDIEIRLTGNSPARICLPQSRVRVALEYLIGPLVEGQPSHGRVDMQLQDSGSMSILKAHTGVPSPASGSSLPLEPVSAILRQARLAIARRILEAAGVSLELPKNPAVGFVLRIPHPSLQPV